MPEATHGQEQKSLLMSLCDSRYAFHASTPLFRLSPKWPLNHKVLAGFAPLLCIVAYGVVRG